MSEHIITKFLVVSCIVLSIVLSFELGLWAYKLSDAGNDEPEQVDSRLNEEIYKLNATIVKKESELMGLKAENANYEQKQKELIAEINTLKAKVAGISTSAAPASVEFPFAVPSTGIVGTQNGTFGGDMYGMKHLGIDIWTTLSNGGRVASHKGNKVVSACDGKVVNIGPANGSLTVLCDEINARFNVPQRKVYTHYSHLGHAETKELFMVVQRNQRVEKGQLVGYQGDLSSFFPEMRNVHLHFSVFTGHSETDPNGGAIDPCKYIGGTCTKRGEMFKAN